MYWDKNVDPYDTQNVVCHPMHGDRRGFSAFHATVTPDVFDRQRTSVGMLAAADSARTRVGVVGRGLEGSTTGPWVPFRHHWNVSRCASGSSHLGLVPSYNRDIPVTQQSSKA